MRLDALRVTAGAGGLLVCLLGVTACGGGDSENEAPTVTETVTAPADAPAAVQGDAEQRTLPNMVGKDLQLAQDTAQAAGFYALASRDATGQGRMQVLDRNWVVCSQTPASGQQSTDVTVTFLVVKDDETCP
ncbi:PASTA domain-containing protein [Streptomyces sp. NPDC056549]|uniref:PASTA domain-containing protein n=1 Tax=Streptomyces sp. NPDC056549 TaxID=3345864 RepID=UPI003690B742